MPYTSEFVLRALFIGVGATIVMDLWALLLKQLGIPSLNPRFTRSLDRASLLRSMDS